MKSFFADSNSTDIVKLKVGSGLVDPKPGGPVLNPDGFGSGRVERYRVRVGSGFKLS